MKIKEAKLTTPEVEEGLVEEDFDLEGQDRRSVSANIRNIAKNLRDLKALLREDI
tara:strand:- start:1642 stop:1806 length:165 start_codon:yes stop_codon:yes gene_type:complete